VHDIIKKNTKQEAKLSLG